VSFAQNDNETLVDYITGHTVLNIGAEANRQQIERLLVETKGYAKNQIEVDAPIEMQINDELYRSCVDLVVSVKGRRYMVIKCAPGSLASREREVIAAARLLDTYQVPLAIASDGRTAIVWDTVSGDKLGAGEEAIPSLKEAEAAFDPHALLPLAQVRRSRQQLIFRSYDSMNVNRGVG
jgi:hypothetical protein